MPVNDWPRRELMQSNASIQGIEYVRNGWSAVVEGLPLILGVGMIVQIDAGGLLTLDSNAGAHDHASPAQGDVLRPRILNVGASGGEPDITLWRASAKNLVIDSDGTGTATGRLVYIQLLANKIVDAGASLWAVGASTFPTAPVANDLAYRTDLDMWFFYDGTRWLSSTLYRETFLINDTLQPSAATLTTKAFSPVWESDHDMWVEKLYASTYVATTNNGTNFWTVALLKLDSAFAGTSMGSFTTGADAANTLTKHKATVNALVTPASFPMLNLSLTKTLTPGNITLGAAYTYRLVGV